MSLRLFAATAILGIALASAARGDELLDGVAALPAAIEDINIVGTFTEEDMAGAYRVVIARTPAEDSVTARLFVQRLLYADDGSAAVEKTIEITELADLQVDISDSSGEVNDDGLSLFIDTVKAGEAGELYELFLSGDGTYRFGPASN